MNILRFAVLLTIATSKNCYTKQQKYQIYSTTNEIIYQDISELINGKYLNYKLFGDQYNKFSIQLEIQPADEGQQLPIQFNETISVGSYIWDYPQKLVFFQIENQTINIYENEYTQQQSPQFKKVISQELVYNLNFYDIILLTYKKYQWQAVGLNNYNIYSNISFFLLDPVTKSWSISVFSLEQLIDLKYLNHSIIKYMQIDNLVLTFIGVQNYKLNMPFIYIFSTNYKSFSNIITQDKFYNLTNQYLDFLTLEIVDNEYIYILDKTKGIFIFQLDSHYLDWKFIKHLSNNTQGNYLDIIYLRHQTIKKELTTGVLTVQQINSTYIISIYIDEILNQQYQLNLKYYEDSPLKLGSTPNYLIIQQKQNIFIYKFSNLLELFGTIQKQTIKFYAHSFEDQIVIFTKNICQKYFLGSGKLIFNAGQQIQLNHQTVIFSGILFNEYCNVTLLYTIYSPKDSKLYPAHEITHEVISIEYPESPAVYLPYYQDVSGPNIKLQIKILEYNDPISIVATHLETIENEGIDLSNNPIFASTLGIDFENYLLLIQNSNFEATIYKCQYEKYFLRKTCNFLTMYDFKYKLNKFLFKWYMSDKNQQIYFGYLTENRKLIYICQIYLNNVRVKKIIQNPFNSPFSFLTINNDVICTAYSVYLLCYYLDDRYIEIGWDIPQEVFPIDKDRFILLDYESVWIISYFQKVIKIMEIENDPLISLVKIFVNNNSLVKVYKGYNFFQSIQQFSLLNYQFQRELPLYNFILEPLIVNDNYYEESYILSDIYDNILVLQAYSPIAQQDVLLFYDLTKSSRDCLFLTLPIEKQVSFQIYGVENYYFLSLLNETDGTYIIFKLNNTLNQILNVKNVTTMINNVKIQKTYTNDDYPIEIVIEQSLKLINSMTNIYVDTQSLNQLQINLNKTQQQYSIVLQDQYFQGQTLEYQLSCLQCGEVDTGLVYLDRKMQFEHSHDFGDDEIIKAFQLGECLFIVTASQLLITNEDINNIKHYILIQIPQSYRVTQAFPSGDDIIILQLYNNFTQIINFYKCSKLFDCVLLVQYLIPKDIQYILDIKFTKNNLIILTIENKIHFFGLVCSMEICTFEQSQTTYQTTDSMQEMIVLSFSDDNLVKLLLIQNFIENNGILIIDLIYDGLFLNSIGNQFIKIKAQGLLTEKSNFGSLHLIQYSYSDQMINVQLFVTTYSEGAHYGLTLQLDKYINLNIPIFTVDFIIEKYKQQCLKYYVAIQKNYLSILNYGGAKSIVVILYKIPQDTSKILKEQPIMPIGGNIVDDSQHFFVYLYTKDNKVKLLFNRNSTQIVQYSINEQISLNIQNIDLFQEDQPITLKLDNYISSNQHTFKIKINFNNEENIDGLSFIEILVFSILAIVILIVIGICIYYVKCKKKKKKIYKSISE